MNNAQDKSGGGLLSREKVEKHFGKFKAANTAEISGAPAKHFVKNFKIKVFANLASVTTV